MIHKKFEGQQGIWSNYVENHLLPRLNGFELLMASYAMAHLKLDLLLSETGYKPTKDQRLRVYLTNSLEEHHPDTDTLFANWLSTEANEANRIKRDTPVMCIIGNPPYSGESANKGKWIMSLMEDYKKEPGGKEKLKEQNSKFINDDYVKFIRYGQHFIEKNGTGILAFINPHGFIDNPTFRGMRWNLLKTYDKIYIIDLHGNAKKKETSPDGSVDVNVFDIEQGVSINFFVKTGYKKGNDLGQILHYNVFGKRELKYSFLTESSLSSIIFQKIESLKPHFFFCPKQFKYIEEYEKGFSVAQLFTTYSLGIQTHRDQFVIDFSEKNLERKILDVLDSSISNEELLHKYNLNENSDFKISTIRKLKFESKKLIKIDYRPFDVRNIYYDKKFIDRDRFNVMKHLTQVNASLILSKHLSTYNFQHIFISKFISESCLISVQTKEGGYCFPLYFYQEYNRTPNFKIEIVLKIANQINLAYIDDDDIVCDLATDRDGTLYPMDILDYIYAVLHSPQYREKYKEFLKIDFPRIPYPKDLPTFRKLTELGSQIRQIHLLESPVVEHYITQYPVDGGNEVIKPVYMDGKVFINDTQYFNNVPEVAWNFYIGGYQPAQKWLKDRKGRKLEYEDIQHYQKIIVALTETDRLMKEIDKIDFL